MLDLLLALIFSNLHPLLSDFSLALHSFSNTRSIYSFLEKGCLTNGEKFTRQYRQWKVIMSNGGFYGCLSGPQGVSAWWKETAQPRIRSFSFFVAESPKSLKFGQAVVCILPRCSRAKLIPMTWLKSLDMPSKRMKQVRLSIGIRESSQNDC